MEEMRAKVNLSEERALMQAEDSRAILARETEKLCKYEEGLRLAKENLKRQQDKWVKGFEEKQRQLE
jgi:hypothetical protein